MCEFCKNEFEVGNKAIEDRYAIELQVDEDMLYAWCSCGRRVVAEINFCPICGRDLRKQIDERANS